MMRTASSDSATLAHPKPDLQITRGAYVGNVERLEEHAVRLSMGSDIGEEIRRLHFEQKLSESRRSSMREPPARSVSQRSRKASYSSQQNSIVDVNHAARWGGYSPSGFIGSPVGSIHSGSWSQTSVQRQRSTSRPTRLDVVSEPGAMLGSPFESAPPPDPEPDQPSTRSSFAEEMKAIAQDIQDQLDGTTPPAQTDEEEVTEAHLQDRNSIARLDSPFDIPDRPPTAASTNTYQQAQTLFNDFDGVHYAPGSRVTSGVPESEAGMRVMSMASMAPRPKSGTWAQPPPEEGMVYYPAPVPRMLNLPAKLSKRPAAAAVAKRRDKLMSGMDVRDREAAPWLDNEDGNGLSQQHANGKARSVNSKQALDFAGLPPQLRASLFFDAQPLHQEVEVKNDSAVVTLDSILEASASLPASAFTDHPFAGNEGAKIYRREVAPPSAARRSTTSILNPDKDAARKSTLSLSGPDIDKNKVKKRRSSFGLIFGKRSHSTNELVGAEKLRETQGSRLTMHTMSDLATVNADIYHGDVPGHERDAASDEGEDSPLQGGAVAGVDQDDSDDGEGHYQEDHETPMQDPDEEEDEEDYFGPPTTLLAELQKRKAQQKSRNRTAATAFPKGMHSTLLEMDAVAEVEQKRRIKARVPLAWEDPDVKAQMEAENDDEDVPLGLLFTKQNGQVRKVNKDDAAAAGGMAEADWDRPLGLIEQREMEDNEPLSKRRNRLRGVEPQTLTKRNTAYTSGLNVPMGSQVNLATPSGGSSGYGGSSPNPEAERKEGDDDEEEGETLAQRVRRLKIKSALGGDIGDRDSRPLSSAFSTELLGELGMPEEGADNKKDDTLSPPEQPTEASTPDPDETLGQRRARLQAQAMLSGTAPGQLSRQPSGSSANLLGGRTPSALGLQGYKRRSSMADLLASHPLTAQANTVRKVSDDALNASMPAGSLLAQNEIMQRRNKKRISDANALGNHVGGVEGPLIDVRGKREGEFDRGMLGRREREREAAAAMRQSSYGSMPGAGMQSMPSMDPMAMQMNGVSMNGGTMGMMGGMPNMMGGGMMGMGGGMQMQSPMGMGMPGMMPQMNMGMMGMPGMMPQMGMMMPQQHQQMPMNNNFGMGGMNMNMGGGMGSMSTPNLTSLGGNQSTYAAFAQQQMGMGPNGAVDMANMRPEQRDVIDRWRQSVMP